MNDNQKDIKVLCVIPSRIGSTRLARKPLLPIQGKPMVQWTYENAARCPLIDELIVATDSTEIFDCIESIGGKAKLTPKDIPNGTERSALVALDYPEHNVIINLQGDEPFIKPTMLAALIEPYYQQQYLNMTTLAYPLAKEKYHEPGAVKVIVDKNHKALYFSRAPIPFLREERPVPVYHHMGLYAYSKPFLERYVTLEPTPLELAESLEQLRVLEHGYQIHVCLTSEKTLEINTIEEYEQAQSFVY